MIYQIDAGICNTFCLNTSSNDYNELKTKKKLPIISYLIRVYRIFFAGTIENTLPWANAEEAKKEMKIKARIIC